MVANKELQVQARVTTYITTGMVNQPQGHAVDTLPCLLGS